MTKNTLQLTVIAILTIALAGSIWYQSTADYTMTQQEANHLSKPAIVYMKSGVQEDDLYIAPNDIGRVDLQHLPNN